MSEMEEIKKELFAICDTIDDPHALKELARRCAERARQLFVNRLRPGMQVSFQDSRGIERFGKIQKVSDVVVRISEGSGTPVIYNISPPFVEPIKRAPKKGTGIPPST